MAALVQDSLVPWRELWKRARPTEVAIRCRGRADKATMQLVSKAMKIEGIEIIPLDVKLDRAFEGGTYQVRSRPTIVTRIHLENGIVGETYGGDEFHTQREIVNVARDHLTPLIVGRDVRDSVALWERVFGSPIDLGNRG